MPSIREYEKGDEEGLISLFNEVYNTSRKEDYWNWQFMDNPTGNPIIIVAEDDSKIIGQCTLLPAKIVVKGDEILTGMSIDTMISKDFRGKGIYEEIVLKSYEIGKAEEMKARIGFPTPETYKALFGNRIDARFVADIPLFINIYKMEKFLVGIVKLKFLANILAIPSLLITKFVYREKKMKTKENYIIKEIEEFDEGFDLLWDKIKTDSPIMTKRSSEFLNWRIKDHPEIDYKTFGAYLHDELAGYIILKSEKRKVRKNTDLYVGTIIDMMGISEDVIIALYYKAKEYFKSIRIDFVVCWASESMQYRQLVIDFGFYRTKGRVPFVVKNFSEDEELDDNISVEKNWYLMPIESDIY